MLTEISGNWRSRAEGLIASIIGRRFTEMVRAGGMGMFRFGGFREAIAELGPSRGKLVQQPEFSLHVQCPWRISRGSRVVIGQGDIFEKALSADLPLGDSGQSDESRTLLDDRAAELKGRLQLGLEVIGITIDELMDLEIVLADNYRLSIFPMSSSEDEDSESWRFMSLPHNTHIVTSPCGVEFRS